MCLVDRTVDSFENDAGETDDRVEWGAQFMAHVGQELALNPIHFLHFLEGSLRKLIRAGIFNTHRNLVGKNLQHRQFGGGECAGLLGLDVQSADNPVADFQRNGQFSACFGQQRIGEVEIRLAHIVDHQRLTGHGDRSDH